MLRYKPERLRMGIGEFSKVAPYLTNPLVLIGFCLFLIFGTYRLILKSSILAPLSPRQSAAVLRMILWHGFWISVAMMILGVAYVGFQAHWAGSGHQGTIIQQTGDCGANVSGDHSQANVNCHDKTEGVK
jgi:hypothetical protein